MTLTLKCVLTFWHRCAPHPAPPQPKEPATPPRSARLLVALLMETVRQDLVFAVSWIIMFLLFQIVILSICVTRCDFHIHLRQQYLYEHYVHQKLRVCLSSFQNIFQTFLLLDIPALTRLLQLDHARTLSTKFKMIFANSGWTSRPFLAWPHLQQLECALTTSP